MEKILEESLELLEEFFNNDSRKNIEKKLEIIDKMDIEKISFDKYLKYFHSNFNFITEHDDDIYYATINEVFQTELENNPQPTFIQKDKNKTLSDSFQEDNENKYLERAA